MLKLSKRAVFEEELDKLDESDEDASNEEHDGYLPAAVPSPFRRNLDYGTGHGQL